jgi:hypothetical protein
MTRLLLLLFAALCFASPASAGASRYAVVFEVNLLENGRVDKFVVDHVVDAHSGSKDPVKLDVPAEYVAAIRQKLDAKAAPPTKRHFFTYFFFDPNDRTNTDIGTRK